MVGVVSFRGKNIGLIFLHESGVIPFIIECDSLGSRNQFINFDNDGGRKSSTSIAGSFFCENKNKYRIFVCNSNLVLLDRHNLFRMVYNDKLQ